MVELETSDYDTVTTIKITKATWKLINAEKQPGDSFNSVVYRKFKESVGEATKRTKETKK
jgi:hypothetical protein